MNYNNYQIKSNHRCEYSIINLSNFIFIVFLL